MSRLRAWLRRIPLFRSHVGRHVETAIEAMLDSEWAAKLREVRREARGRRPVYTPPRRYRVDLPNLDDGWYAGAQLEPLPAMDRVLAAHVVAALTNARPDETVIDVNHDDLPQWLEAIVGGAPFDNHPDSDTYLDWLFAGTPAGVAS